MKSIKIKSKIINIALFASFALIVNTSCDDTINVFELDNKIIPSSNVSYNQYIQPVFTAKCANAGCHDDQIRAGNLSFTSYVNATSDYLVVAPGLPDNSKLVWAVEGNYVDQMPPLGYWGLTSNQIAAIRIWVKEGAKNN
ncbi:MAG: c-type cytochrome domain-containing protein [Melioribacteraceae bacterium]